MKPIVKATVATALLASMCGMTVWQIETHPADAPGMEPEACVAQAVETTQARQPLIERRGWGDLAIRPVGATR